MAFQKVLEEIKEEVSPLIEKGKVADYIPALKDVDINNFAIALKTIDGETFTVGDADKRFSIQSISKVFALFMAFSAQGEKLWKRVGVEPSGNPFNSLVQLEHEKGKPRNPFK